MESTQHHAWLIVSVQYMLIAPSLSSYPHFIFSWKISNKYLSYSNFLIYCNIIDSVFLLLTPFLFSSSFLYSFQKKCSYCILSSSQKQNKFSLSAFQSPEVWNQGVNRDFEETPSLPFPSLCWQLSSFGIRGL